MKNKKMTKYELFIQVLILLNVTAVMLESVKSINEVLGQFFYWFEIFSVAVFTIEYIIRIKLAEKKLKFIFSFFGLIDLVAILPFYLPQIVNMDLRMLRILRLARLLRVVKIFRDSTSVKLVGRVLREKKEPLMFTLFVTFLLLIFASSLMYYVEHDVQPEAFGNIFQSFWWAVATLTTIGYGDIYPVTAWGKLLSAIIAILGIGLVALPTGIIGSGFVEAMERKEEVEESEEEKGKITCPHCGKSIGPGES